MRKVLAALFGLFLCCQLTPARAATSVTITNAEAVVCQWPFTTEKYFGLKVEGTATLPAKGAGGKWDVRVDLWKSPYPCTEWVGDTSETKDWVIVKNGGDQTHNWCVYINASWTVSGVFTRDFPNGYYEVKATLQATQEGNSTDDAWIDYCDWCIPSAIAAGDGFGVPVAYYRRESLFA